MEDAKLQNNHEELCIKCLKSLMNNKHGLSSVMADPEALSVIALSLRSPLLKTRSLVLEILGAVCFTSGGHKRVLEAMNHFSQQAGERYRFETVLGCLSFDLMYKAGWIGNSRIGNEEKIERVMELQVSSLSFINAIICAGPGKELDFRMHMRYEFIRLGMDRVIQRLVAADHDFLDTQIHIYLEKANADEAELAKRYDQIKMNSKDPEEMFSLLWKSIKDSRSQPHAVSLLKHLMLLPIEPIKK